MSFQKAQWLFPVAVSLHNAEEAALLPQWASAHRQSVPWHIPSRERIWVGLLLLTAAAFVITYLSARGGKQSVWAYLLFGYIAAMLTNVFVPHLPATLYYARYTPGLVTAVLINLPVMNLLLRAAVAEHWVSGTKATLYAVLVCISIAAGIGALFVLP